MKLIEETKITRYRQIENVDDNENLEILQKKKKNNNQFEHFRFTASRLECCSDSNDQM